MRWGPIVVVICGCGISVQGIAENAPASDGGVTPSTTQDASTSSTDSSTPKDAGETVDADASLSDGCVNADAFVFDGEPTLKAVASGVITLTMKKDKRAALTHTFPATKPFTRSKLELQLDVQWDNSWGPGAGDYIPFLHQYFAPSDETDSYNDVVFAQNGLESHIHTGAATGADSLGLGDQSVPRAAGVTVFVETTWANPSGSLKVTTAPGKFWKLDLPTIATGITSSSLTVQLGGTAKGSIPDLTIALHRACVTFDP